jgi:DNA uptake protein ComE-like DNA-binding protein
VVLFSRLRAAAHALFPPEGEEKKSEVKQERHSGGKRISASPAGALAFCVAMLAGTRVDKRAMWPWLSLIPLGLGAWAPIYAGVRARKALWIALGVVWSACIVAGFVANGVSRSGSHGDNAFAGALFIIGWVGAIATSFVLRPAYERAMSSELGRAKEEAERRLDDRRRAVEIARANPDLAQEIGIGRPDRPGAVDVGLVDVNNAPVTALLGLPGVDGELATQIVEARGRIGGFSSLEDCGAALDIDGGIVEGLRGHVVFLPRR